MNDFKIKVCGMTSFEQVQQLAEIGVDYAGFIFYRKSPRFVNDKINPKDLKVFTALKKAGVFVNETVDTIISTVDKYNLDIVQLHGDETPEFCNHLKSFTKVIKAIRINEKEPVEEIIAAYANATDYFLFDTKAKEYGGTGKKFNWSVLENTKIIKPYFLSGGIGQHDVPGIKIFVKQQKNFGVDVNSQFEITPGIKNIHQLQIFINKLRAE